MIQPIQETARAGRELARRHTVICVDDDLAVLASLRRQLRQEPYDLLSSADPEVVLEWVRTFDVSLVIADHLLPEMSGCQLMDRIGELSPRTAGVMLTGYAPQVLATPLHPNVRIIFSKPWDDEEFRWTLREILHEREARDGPT